MIKKMELADTLLIVLLSISISILLSSIHLDLNSTLVMLIVASIPIMILILWKFTGLLFLKSEESLRYIGLYLSLLIAALFCISPYGNILTLSFMSILFVFCLIRIIWMYTNRRQKENITTLTLDSLLRTDDYNGQYVNDIPTDRDLFGIDSFIDSLTNRIVTINGTANNVIGLIGPWGSGKTSNLYIAYDKYLKDEY